MEEREGEQEHMQKNVADLSEQHWTEGGPCAARVGSLLIHRHSCLVQPQVRGVRVSADGKQHLGAPQDTCQSQSHDYHKSLATVT